MKDAAVFDPTVIDGLRELGDGDDATYLDQAEEILGRLREALAFEDRDAFSRAAHALAGASLTWARRRSWASQLEDRQSCLSGSCLSGSCLSGSCLSPKRTRRV